MVLCLVFLNKTRTLGSSLYAVVHRDSLREGDEHGWARRCSRSQDSDDLLVRNEDTRKGALVGMGVPSRCGQRITCRQSGGLSVRIEPATEATAYQISVANSLNRRFNGAFQSFKAILDQSQVVTRCEARRPWAW